ncbi:unnamed protein product, partial [Ectocarpus sp. 12 AP-2014]
MNSFGRGRNQSTKATAMFGAVLQVQNGAPSPNKFRKQLYIDREGSGEPTVSIITTGYSRHDRSIFQASLLAHSSQYCFLRWRLTQKKKRKNPNMCVCGRVHQLDLFLLSFNYFFRCSGTYASYSHAMLSIYWHPLLSSTLEK